MDTEYNSFKAWLTAPFTTQIPMWQIILTFIVFVIIGYVVVDNLELLKKGLQV